MLPLLSISHIEGENAYRFADIEFSNFVLDMFREKIPSVVYAFYDSMSRNLQGYLQVGRTCIRREIGPINSESELNKSLIFYTKGLLGIKNTIQASKYYYDNTKQITYCGELAFDGWTTNGAIFYLKNELIKGIISDLFVGIQKTNEELIEWTKEVSLS